MLQSRDPCIISINIKMLLLDLLCLYIPFRYFTMVYVYRYLVSDIQSHGLDAVVEELVHHVPGLVLSVCNTAVKRAEQSCL